MGTPAAADYSDYAGGCPLGRWEEMCVDDLSDEARARQSESDNSTLPGGSGYIFLNWLKVERVLQMALIRV